jgi:hypothetical protein
MGSITLDPALRARLNGLSEQVEVRDENGQLVAVVLPLAHYKSLLANLEIPFSDEEMAKFKDSGEGCSLAEIWRRLGVK